MDFIYLFRVLLKRKWIIIISGILAAGIAYYFTRNQPQKFRSVSQISTGFAISKNDEVKINQETFDIYEADNKFNNVIYTASSPAVTSLLSYNLMLHDLQNPRPFRVLNAEAKNTPEYKQINLEQAKIILNNKLKSLELLTTSNPEEKKLLEFLKLYRYDYKTLSRNLSVSRYQRTDYLQIEYFSENPDLSAYAVNTLFEEFLRYYRNLRKDKTTESIDTLKSIMDKRKQELDNKNALLARAGITDASDQSMSTMDLIGALERSLQDEKSKLTLKQFELRNIDMKLGTVPSNDGDNEEIVLARNAKNEAFKAYLNNKSDKALYTKYLELKDEYDAVLQKYNTVVRTPGQSKAELQSKKNDLQIDIAAIGETVKSYENRIGALRGNVSSLSSRGAAVQTLINDRDLADKEFIEARRRYNDAIDMGTSSVNNFKQVLAGQPAIEPEPSKRKVIIGMAFISAVVIAILVILVLAYMDTSVKTPQIFSKTVNLKLISIVNFMNLKNKEMVDIISNKDSDVKHDRAERKRRTVFKESIRKLRYEIENSGKKIFLFTSTRKGEGKTTLVQALAYSMSLRNKKILIIDTNFCNNDLTVQLHADPILEKVAAEANGSVVDHVKKVSKDVSEGRVFAIGSEGGDYTPLEVLPNENILRHLHELTTEYDYILLEGPPLNDFSDSRELAGYVDCVIAVFASNHIIKQIDRESIKFYKELNGKFVGSILNMVDLKDMNVTA